MSTKPAITCVPIPPPATKALIGVNQVSTGAWVSPVRRLRIIDPNDWEEFVREWVDSLKALGRYAEVQRCGGGGDLGRDIMGFYGTIGSSEWDNYQCKHYKNPLSIANISGELGKCFLLLQ